MPPRRRITPPTTSGFRAPPLPRSRGRLRLSELRSEESVALDGSEELPPFERWDRFYGSFRESFKQGQHITIVGPTGSGKTTLARQLIVLRRYVVVLATKARDSSLYDPLEKLGFETVDHFDPDPDQTPRLIFKPTLGEPTAAAMAKQREAFRSALIDIFAMGRWCVYCDEIRYLSEYLGLKTELETLWLQGRSLDVSMIAATQRAVSIPLVAFDQASHLFLYRNTDRQSYSRMAELSGADVDQARYAIPRLPFHEALYVETATGHMVRTSLDARALRNR